MRMLMSDSIASKSNLIIDLIISGCVRNSRKDIHHELCITRSFQRDFGLD
jgi:hypothetical protein